MNPLKFSGLNVLVHVSVSHTIIGFYKSWSFDLCSSFVIRTCFSRCIESIVTILETHPDRIVFVVDDVPIRRVEFIVRRCQNVNLFEIYFSSLRNVEE